MRTKFALCLLLSAVPAQAAETLIKNTTVMTVSNGTIENGAVLIRDGKIAAVGRSVEAGPDATVIDGAGMWLTPGLIDCHSHIASDAINEGSVSVSSMVGIQDTLNATDIDIYRDLAGGVTTANVLHGSANPIGGKNAVIKLRWGKPEAELLFEGAKSGIKFALGENPKRPGIPLYARDNPRRYPASRMGVEDVIRAAFLEARGYMEHWTEYEKKKAAGERVSPPRKDFRLEPLAEVLRGERLVHAHCYRADEILMLIRVAEDFGFKIATFQHVLEGYKVAKEIAAHGAGASTFSDWWAYKVEAYDAIPYNAAIMTRKGVLVSINSDSAEEARHLNQEAGKTVRYGGLSDDEALALVTLNPAKQLRIDDRVGSIEVGKDADLVLFNHHPLSVYSVPEMVFVDGQLYFSREKDKQRQQRLMEEKAKLLEEEKAKKADEKKGETVEPVDLTGSWDIQVFTPEATYRMELAVTQTGDRLTGQMVSSDFGTLELYDGSVSGASFTFKVTVDPGEGPLEVTFDGSVSGDEFSGTATPEGDQSAPVEGKKRPAAGSAEWSGGVR